MYTQLQNFRYIRKFKFTVKVAVNSPLRSLCIATTFFLFIRDDQTFYVIFSFRSSSLHWTEKGKR